MLHTRVKMLSAPLSQAGISSGSGSGSKITVPERVPCAHRVLTYIPVIGHLSSSSSIQVVCANRTNNENGIARVSGEKQRKEIANGKYVHNKPCVGNKKKKLVNCDCNNCGAKSQKRRIQSTHTRAPTHTRTHTHVLAQSTICCTVYENKRNPSAGFVALRVKISIKAKEGRQEVQIALKHPRDVKGIICVDRNQEREKNKTSTTIFRIPEYNYCMCICSGESFFYFCFLWCTLFEPTNKMVT